MKCPNCGAIYNGTHRFCGLCGTPLEYETEKKGTHRVPLLILLGLSALGIALFFLFPREAAEVPASATPWFSVSRRGELTFNEYRYDGSSEVEIPADVYGKTVTAIAQDGFWDCDEITTVILPDTVTTIGDYAFSDCDSLKAMELPGSVTTIGWFAFADCPELEALHIPASVEEISMGAFDNCESLGYIFYGGTAEQWRELCTWPIESHPMICTPEGDPFRSE